MEVTKYLPIGQILALAIAVISGIFIGLQLVNALFHSSFEELEPPGFDDAFQLSYAMGEFALLFGLLIASWALGLGALDAVAVTLFLSALSLIVLAFAATIDIYSTPFPTFGAAIVLDIVALILAFEGDFRGPRFRVRGYLGVGNILGPVASAFSVSAQFMSLTAILEDGLAVARRLGSI
jgi:hypothetical protein